MNSGARRAGETRRDDETHRGAESTPSLGIVADQLARDLEVLQRALVVIDRL
jgi:hypothetical protein